MGALATLISKLAQDNNIVLSDEELAGLEGLPGGPQLVPPSDVLTMPLPGHAAGEIELFMSDDLSTSVKEPKEEKDGLMWYPIIRSGQWAVRPGTQGTKKRVPLKVVEGHSKNQRKEIGLQDLLDAHNDEAIQHVTVPTSHNNTTLENQGFVDRMKIVAGQFKDKATKKMVDCKVLMGGYRITEPETKGKLTRGTIANRSAGILYDYVNTETGKTYPAVVEHVALTNKPWITGMVSFGRPLSEGGIQTVGLSLSDEAPLSEDEYAEVLQLSISDEDRDFLAVAGVAWDHETSPSWLQSQVNAQLDEARQAKRKKARAAQGEKSYLVYDEVPYYRCREAKPGSALITDGWSDESNAWIASISVKDGVVELEEFSKWAPVAKVYMPDDREAPPKAKEPLAEQPTPEPEQLSRLQLAQRDRARRARGELGTTTEHEPPRGGGNMAGENGAATLSEEAQRLIQEAQAEAAAAKAANERLSEQVQRLTGTVQGGETKSYITWLGSDEGLGLSAERGFSGFLTEVEAALLADDGMPALQSEHFATDANKGGEISFSSELKRIFGALHKAREGKKSLGEVLSEPADPAAEVELDEHGKPKLDEKGDPILKAKPEGEGGTNAGEPEAAGKPPAGDKKGEGEQLSTDERVTKIAEASPAMAAVIGGVPKQEPVGAGSGGSAEK